MSATIRCRTLFTVATLAVTTLFAASPTPIDPKLEEFVKGFKGRGALNDDSKPLTPEETIKNFKLAPGLKMEVVLNEPIVRQPLNLHFDERGRLWIVQYQQYPFPAGLKVIKYDQYLRAVFDKVPEPPPKGVKGKDKITIHEDTDGDGKYDKHKTFVDGLNIATSVTTGRGGVWVLNPPYLLFYPDRNQDDIPDGDPEVHLSGFGLEDTHSEATSLNWGPDGWLYGANGSTTTGLVKGIRFLGQCIWRYHPVTGAFEIFAEGGGNTFCLDFDSKGRAFSGSNFGNTRGMHYVQGSAGIKNWGKHGPLINPYSFGWFEHMAHKGFEPRFAQSMIIYEGGALPGYEGKVIASMSLVNRVQSSQLDRDTSTYRTEDTEPMVLTEDRWFRPVDTETGPDGAVYLADWYDSRLTHVDPRDTWDHDRGRIYRMEAEAFQPVKPFNLGKLSSQELIPYLSHANKWYRQMAVRLFWDRADKSVIPALSKLVAERQDQLALDAFWALVASGGFNDALAAQTMNHKNEFIRAWTIRLLGDTGKVSAGLQKRMTDLARTEPEVQVRSQLACTSKRLPAADALPILRELLLHQEDVNDKHLPLLIWWAIESKAANNRDQILALLKDTPLWNTPIFSKFVTPRLGQRYTAERSDANLNTAAQLLALAPSPTDVDALVKGMEAGLQGDVVKSVPTAMQKELAQVWESRPKTPTLISFAARLGHEQATGAALERIADSKASLGDRQKFLGLLAERRVTTAVPVLLDLLTREKSEAFRADLLTALQRFNEERIATTVLQLFPAFPDKLRASALGALASRATWSRQLLTAVDNGTIKKEQVSAANVMAIQGHQDAQCDALIKKHWGRLRQSSEEKEQRIADVRKLLAGPKGDMGVGRNIFRQACVVCHTLNGEGAKIGPDLTGYERDNLDFMIPAVVDPSLGIREEYTAFNITTKDDQSLTGFILENTPQSVTIMDTGGNKVVLPREQIQTLAASHISLMPEGLLDVLTEQQIRDLFSYLTFIKKP